MIYLSPHTPALLPSLRAAHSAAKEAEAATRPGAPAACEAHLAKCRARLRDAIPMPPAAAGAPRATHALAAAGHAELARSRVTRMVAPTPASTIQQGDIIEGTVTAIRAFGAFVEIAPGVEGLLHISRLWHSDDRHASTDEFFQHIHVGQSITVEVERVLPGHRGHTGYSLSALHPL